MGVHAVLCVPAPALGIALAGIGASLAWLDEGGKLRRYSRLSRRPRPVLLLGLWSRSERRAGFRRLRLLCCDENERDVKMI